MNNFISELPGKPGMDSLRLTCTLCSLALISFGMILYEIVLTRIFAVSLSYHYVFAVLSLAMLGLGMGGLLLKKGRLNLLPRCGE